MIGDSLSKAMDGAERMIAIARAKAATGSTIRLPQITNDVLAGHERFITGAAEQYAANRGWVYACVRLIATRIAGQPIRVGIAGKSPAPAGPAFRTKAMQPAGVEPLESHPLLDLLNDPSSLDVAFSHVFATVASLELTGRALWLVAAEEDGRPSLLNIPISWVQEVDRKRTVWKIRPSRAGTPIPVPGNQVVYFHYKDPADPYGALSPLTALAAAVAADESISAAQAALFSKPHPGLILTVGRMVGADGRPIDARHKLTDAQRMQLVNAVRQAYGGVLQRGEPLILDGLIERAEKLSYTPQELDFLSSAKLTKSRILQGYNTSPILLGEVEGANRASATVADEIFCGNKVNPTIRLLSQCMTEWLGPLFARPGEKLVVWIDEAVPHDPEMKLKRLQLAAARGWITVNEGRAELGYGPVEGGDELPESGGSGGITPAAAELAKRKAALDVEGGTLPAGEKQLQLPAGLWLK